MLARLTRFVPRMLLGLLGAGMVVWSVYLTWYIYHFTVKELACTDCPHWPIPIADFVSALMYVPAFVVWHFLTSNWRDSRRLRRKPRQSEGMLTSVSLDDQMVFASANGLVNPWKVSVEWTEPESKRRFRLHEGTYWTKPVDVIGRKVAITYEDGRPSNHEADLSFLAPFEKRPPARPIRWWEYLPSGALALLSLGVVAYAALRLFDRDGESVGEALHRFIPVAFLVFFAFLTLPDREPTYGRE